MSTDPVSKILDPHFAGAGARELIKLVSPVLRELINHGTHVFERCQTASDALGGVDEDIAPFTLYRTVLEMTDGVDELFKQSCSLASVPLIRTSFEATLAIDYINAKDSARRGLCWVYVDALERLRMYELIRGNPSDEFQRAWKKEFGTDLTEPPDLERDIKNMESMLALPHLHDMAVEYKQNKAVTKRRPQWYALFGGPKNLRLLAEHVDRKAEYIWLYKQWSIVSHAGSASPFLASFSNGAPAFKGMRSPGDIPHLAQVAMLLMLRATKQILRRYRSDEDIGPWYRREIEPGFNRIINATFVEHVIEES